MRILGRIYNATYFLQPILRLALFTFGLLGDPLQNSNCSSGNQNNNWSTPIIFIWCWLFSLVFILIVWHIMSRATYRVSLVQNWRKKEKISGNAIYLWWGALLVWWGIFLSLCLELKPSPTVFSFSFFLLQILTSWIKMSLWQVFHLNHPENCNLFK